MADNVQGKFTVILEDMVTGDAGVTHATLHLDVLDETPIEATGRSWRSAEDAPNPRIGRRLAAARALSDLARQLHRQAWREIYEATAESPTNKADLSSNDHCVIAIDTSLEMAGCRKSTMKAVQTLLSQNPNATVVHFDTRGCALLDPAQVTMMLEDYANVDEAGSVSLAQVRLEHAESSMGRVWGGAGRAFGPLWTWLAARNLMHIPAGSTDFYVDWPAQPAATGGPVATLVGRGISNAVATGAQTFIITTAAGKAQLERAQSAHGHFRLVMPPADNISAITVAPSLRVRTAADSALNKED